MKEYTTEAVIAATGNKINAGGLGAVGYGFFTSNEFVAICGVLAAIGGLFVTWYYKRKDYQLKELEVKQRLKYEELKYHQLEDEITISQSLHGVIKEDK